MFDELMGFEASDLTPDEIDNLRPELYTAVANSSPETKYLKIHDAYSTLNNGRKLIPAECTIGAIYIIRNPLDVAISFAHYLNVTIDRAVEIINDSELSLSLREGKMAVQLRQKLFSWSEHVNSWTTHNDFPVHIIRYEDMQNKTYDTFKSIIEFLGLTNRIYRLNKAIEFSNFEILKKQETQTGFNEKYIKAVSFFREGKISAWKNRLTEIQINKIIDSHKEIMVKFGYLNEDGTINE